MKFFEASFATIITRYYLMMAVVLIAGFANIHWLGLFSLPIFLSAIMGIKFDSGTPTKAIRITKTITTTTPTRNIVNEAA